MKRIAVVPGLVQQTDNRNEKREKQRERERKQLREDYAGIIGDPEGNLASMARLFVRVESRDTG